MDGWTKKKFMLSLNYPQSAMHDRPVNCDQPTGSKSMDGPQVKLFIG